jgi:hypothetical protein
MKRRKFITLLGGAAATWPLAARAQQGERMRRVGVLVAAAADDPEYQARNVAFLQSLQQLGWADDRNVRIDTRWATTNSDDVGRIGSAGAGRPRGCHRHHNSCGATASDPHSADLVCGRHRPGRRRVRREPRAAGRQRDRVHDVRISSISTDVRPAMSTASSRAKSPLTCRCRHRPSTSWWST